MNIGHTLMLKYLGTVTKDIGDDSKGGKKYFLVDCGTSSCSDIRVEVTANGDPDLFVKFDTPPTVSGYSCSNQCDCSSAYVLFCTYFIRLTIKAENV